MRRFYGAFIGPPGAVGLLVLRVIAGSALMLHGWGKIQKPFNWMGDAMPGFLQALAALSEFGGGLALILGLLTPIATAGILCTMATAAVGVHMAKGDPFVASGPGQASYELASVYFAVALTMMLVGPGRLSLDYLLFGHRAAEVAETARETVRATDRAIS